MTMTMTMKTCVAIALLVAPASAIAIADITKCQTGSTTLVTANTNVFTVQVCNLFGATCYMNQVETAAGDCATKALKLENKQCALFPIMTYKDNARTDAAKLQVGGGSKCSVSCSGTDCKMSGTCVSVQCSLGGAPVTYAGPGMTKKGTSSARATGVKDTGAADQFQANTFASIYVSGSKTVLLSRTGNYVGTYERAGSSSGTNAYNIGSLPTIAGNNYGPKACPSATTLVSANTKASKEELRMCGNTGKWVYFGAANLLMDKSMYAKYSGDSATGLATSRININTIKFLSGNSAYQSGKDMDDSRAVYLHDGAASAAVLMTSETIKPSKSTSASMGTQDYAGQWRFYTVVYYCDNYARTDLTACPAANQKMFYVANPNPAPAFGNSASALSNSSGAGTSAGTGSSVAGSGSAAPTAAAATTTKVPSVSGVDRPAVGVFGALVIAVTQMF